MNELIKKMSYIGEIHFYSNNILNLLITYMIMCVAVSVTIAIFRIIIFFIALMIERIVEQIEKIVLGKYHKKSLNYNFFALWFIKLEADVEYFFDWINFDMAKTYKTISYAVNEETILSTVRRFSLDNLIQILKDIIRYFTEVSWKNVIILLVMVYYYFKTNVYYIANTLNNIFIESKVSIGDVLDVFELSVVICTVLYIILDVRYKTSGYSELREERFKELVVLEEKLLQIMQEMNYSLNKNIDIICRKKIIILTNGVMDLSGKKCYIDKHKIVFVDEESCFLKLHNNIFQDLDDMKESFEKIMKLEEELKNSSLSYSNIYLIDHTTMINRIGHFWCLGFDNKEYKEMEFFCKNSMEKWYDNWFVKPTKLFDDKVNLYDKEQTIRKIYDASITLDFELQRAFVLEMYIRKYSRKIIKRLKKLNEYSRFSIL